MNLKLNNDVRRSASPIGIDLKKSASTIKEERRRTGRFIAILVGICLFLLAIYHAWVRRIPIVASLVIPALIMFVYVGWVLYTANRDKHRLIDAEAAMLAEGQAAMADQQTTLDSQNNIEISIIPNKENIKPHASEVTNEWAEISSALLKEDSKDEKISTDRSEITFVKPIILINDKLPEDLDQKWTNLVENVLHNDKLKVIQSRRKCKRKFCRSRRHAAFKRSYSIA